MRAKVWAARLLTSPLHRWAEVCFTLPMRPISRPFVLSVLCLVLGWGLSGCSSSQSESSSAPAKKGWSILPWGGTAKGGDATANIEYQRTRSEGAEPLYTLIARNTHGSKSIEGQMRTTMQVSPSDMKMDSQSFTLAPNEQKKLLVYPARFPLTYEVTASFRD
jgi:hypothetical protein